jgi:hypothetical protein
MIELLPDPTLYEILYVCEKVPQDTQEQCSALDGEIFVPARVAAALTLAPGPKFLIADGAEPLAVGGFIPVREGVYRDWMAHQPLAFAPANWKAVTRCCRQAMDQVLEGPAHRLECVALATRTKAMDWYRLLGYVPEGIQTAAGCQGQDLALFSRVRKQYGTRRR